MIEQNEAKPVLSPLSRANEEFLKKARQLGEQICGYYADLSASEINPAELDRVYELWMNDQNSQKPRDDEVANGLGALMGFIMVERHGFKWMNTKDVWGEGLTAIHPETNWRIYPTDFVWKRVRDKEPKGGFFKTLHDHIAKEIEKKRLHWIADKPGSR